MQFRRGTPPTHVERSVVCELERDEILQILVAYIKKKLNNSALKLDQIQVVGDADGHLEAMTLTGVEVVGLNWPDPKPTPPPETPPAPAA